MVILTKNDAYQSVTTQSGNYPEPIGRHLAGDTFYKHVLIVLLHFRIHFGSYLSTQSSFSPEPVLSFKGSLLLSALFYIVD